MKKLISLFALLLLAPLTYGANVNVQRDTVTNIVTADTIMRAGTQPLTVLATIADNRILGNISGGAASPVVLSPSDWLTFAESGGANILVDGDAAILNSLRLVPVAYGSTVAAAGTLTLTDAHVGRKVTYTTTGNHTVAISADATDHEGGVILVQMLNTKDSADLTVTLPNGLINPYRDYDTATSSSTLTFPASSGGIGLMWFVSNGTTWNQYYVAGDSFTGASVDLSTGAFRLPNGNDPNTSLAGQLTFDANGNWMRGYDGTNQIALGEKIRPISAVVILPNDLADSERDALWIWENVSGMSFIVTGWSAKSDTDDTTLNIEEIDSDGQNNATVDAVEIATNGTGIFTGSDTTITAATIENGHMLVLDFDDTDTPGQVRITIYGYYNADVN